MNTALVQQTELTALEKQQQRQLEAITQIISQRTPDKEIRTRKGRGGVTFRYTDGAYVIRTLNEALGHNWDFEADNEQVIEWNGVPFEVRCRGRLTVRLNGQAVTKVQYGSQIIEFIKERDKDGKVFIVAPVSIGDCFKGAATDAMKKCASLLGVALDLYDSDYKAENYADDDPAPVDASDPRPKTLGELVTPKQLWMIRNMERETGANVDELCREKFGCDLAEISKKAASVIIDALKGMGAKGPEVATTEKDGIEQESARRIEQAKKLRPVAVDAAIGGDYDKIGELIVAAELEDASGNRRFVYQQLAKGDFAGMASYLKQTPEYMAEKFKHLAVTASTGPSKDLMRNPNYGPEIAKRFNAVVQQLTIRGVPPDELLREANVCLHDAGRKQIRSRYEADDESARIICDTFEAWVMIHDRKQQESRASQS